MLPAISISDAVGHCTVLVMVVVVVDYVRDCQSIYFSLQEAVQVLYILSCSDFPNINVCREEPVIDWVSGYGAVFILFLVDSS